MQRLFRVCSLVKVQNLNTGAAVTSLTSHAAVTPLVPDVCQNAAVNVTDEDVEHVCLMFTFLKIIQGCPLAHVLLVPSLLDPAEELLLNFIFILY